MVEVEMEPMAQSLQEEREGARRVALLRSCWVEEDLVSINGDILKRILKFISFRILLDDLEEIQYWKVGLWKRGVLCKENGRSMVYCSAMNLDKSFADVTATSLELLMA